MKKKHDFGALVTFMQDAEDIRDIFRALKCVLRARRIKIIYTNEDGNESAFLATDPFKDEKDEQWRRRKVEELSRYMYGK